MTEERFSDELLERARLTPMQHRFVEAYFPPEGNYNATEAARKAGYSWPNKAGPRVKNSPVSALLRELHLERCRRAILLRQLASERSRMSGRVASVLGSAGGGRS